MKKIAIIAPCILPVPASRGGAVEELITCIINQNEISQKYVIDLYTIADTSYEHTSFSFTNIIPISLDKYISIADRVSDKVYRTLGEKYSSKRLYNKIIISEFMKRAVEQGEQYDVVIVENLMSLASDLLDALDGKRSFPIYFHMHNDVDVYRSPDYIKKLTASGIQFLAISDYIKSQILKYSSDAVVHVLYNGVDLKSYTMTKKQPDTNVKFLYSGRVIPDKGVLELVKAFSALIKGMTKDEAEKLSLDIIGFSEEGIPYEKTVLREVRKLSGNINCQKRISTEEMAEKYNEYDIVVMPTIYEEPFGLVALETIAKGIPLIATNSGAIPEVVGDGAFVVDKNRNLIENLTAAMKTLSADCAAREALGKKGYQVARKRLEFNIDYYYDNLVKIVEKSIDTKMVSIIVPVYNVEDQLSRCVESLIRQTYTNLEIILVDDGSTDSSGKLCDEYKMQDSRIKVVHQQNAGLSGARNSGLDIASGEYIYFVDSDDYLAKDTIDKLIHQLHRFDADVMACGFSYVYDGAKPEFRFTSDEPGVWSGKESVIQMMRTNNICTVVWNKLYKAELWEGVRFPVGHIHEDEATTYKVLYKAKIVAYTPECLYKYFQRGGSLMNAGLSGRYKDYILALNNRIAYFNDRNEKKLVEHSLVSLLEYIKYAYRNVESPEKETLSREYADYMKGYGLPTVLGMKKTLALLLWKYYKY